MAERFLGRRFYRGRNFQRALSIEELRVVARRAVPNFVLEYVEGGSEDEQALAWNRSALDALRFVPNTLVNTRDRHQRIELFGQTSPSPLIIAPTGLNGMLRHHGDAALAQAAAGVGIPFTLSTVSNMRLEDVASRAGGRLWMQLYMIEDRAAARDIVRRADRAGYEALVFTTDANLFGHREWDKRNYRTPGQLTLPNLFDVARHPRWMWDVLRHGIPWFDNLVDFLPPEAMSARTGVAYFPKLFVPNIDWDDVAWLRDAWPRKLIIKGILNPADAGKAAAAGCDGIVVTNHGGRQLDSCVSPVEVLPDIVSAVGDKMTVIVDSGFRRGDDVVKAVALGADAVMVGRAALYGLAAGGEAGVAHALNLLMAEIDRTLGQLGCRSLDEVHPGMLVGGGEK